MKFGTESFELTLVERPEVVQMLSENRLSPYDEANFISFLLKLLNLDGVAGTVIENDPDFRLVYDFIYNWDNNEVFEDFPCLKIKTRGAEFFVVKSFLGMHVVDEYGYEEKLSPFNYFINTMNYPALYRFI